MKFSMKFQLERLVFCLGAALVSAASPTVAADKPFFEWVNFTHMHFRTHVKPESLGQSGCWMSEYADAMIDHDKNVGTVLDKLDELGLADNTFVMYSTDNGPHLNTWPDAAMTPFRNEKNSNWEGAYRVPTMVRYPGKINAGSISNEIVSHLDWLLDRAFLLVPAQAYVGEFLATFREFPPRQKAASFNLDDILQQLQEGGGAR